MRIWISLILLIGFSLQLSAQEYYYYYKGAKVDLTLNTNYLFISAPEQTYVDNAQINASSNINQAITQREYTSQTLLQPANFKEKYPVRFWKEVELNNRYTQRDYLTQIQVIRRANPNLVVAPYFRTRNTEKIGLSNFFYVKLKQEDDFPVLLEQIKAYGLELVGYNKFMPLWYTISVAPNSPNALQMANTFYETGLFQYAEPDLMVDILALDVQGTDDIELVPNDPLYQDQWCLNNTGQDGGIAGIDINAEAAWDISLGDNINIAVIDHGFEMDHPDLADNTVGIGYDTETGTSPTQVWGPHGTACAGIAAARGDNNEGIIGVAPNAGLISISNRLVSSPTVRQDLADGINWAWQNGADIISNSWGHATLVSTLIDDAITNALTNGRDGLGTVVVFASGNDNVDGAAYPSNSNPLILCVGANDRCGVRSGRIDIVPDSCDPWCPWPCRAGSNFGTPLDVVAGGTSISTTDRQGDVVGCADYNPCDNNTYTNLNYYANFSGTSAACPYVAGVAALVLSVNPNLTVQEVNDIIEQSAQKIRTDLYTYSTTTGRPNGTWNNEMGYGLVDAYQAVLLAGAEECPENLLITQTYTAGAVDDQEASNVIVSLSEINSGADVTFDAGVGVYLFPGFHAQIGCEFLGVIDGCGGVQKTEGDEPQVNTPAQITSRSTISDLKCYPNPFSESTILSYTLDKDQRISLSIFNPNGQEVARLLENADQIAGKHEMTFDGKDLPAGIYFYRFTDGAGNVSMGKMSKLE